MAAPYGVTDAMQGVTLETNGTLFGVQADTLPPPGQPAPPMLNPTTGISTGRSLTLIDDSGPGRPRQLLNIDVHTSHVGRAHVLVWSSSPGLPFRRLTVGSVPPGSRWTVHTLVAP